MTGPPCFPNATSHGGDQTYVIDTADWRLIVPIQPSLNLSGSRLTAKVTPSAGGPPACTISSDDGSISWTADNDGLTDHLAILAPKALRGGWLAQSVTTVFFDVHRYVTGSTADEWLGRTQVTVLPASDSSMVAQQARNGGFLLVPGQPCTGVLLPALQVGPQGPPGRDGTADMDTLIAIARRQALVSALIFG